MASNADVVAALEPWLAKHRRPAWRARISDLPGPQAPGSQFGGAPALRAGEPWPACPHCRQPLSLFVQLDLASLPDELPLTTRRGLLQVFYCTNEIGCGAQFDAWQAFSTCHLIRIADGALTPSSERPPTIMPRKTIVGWDRFVDVPHPEDHAALGVDYEYDFPRRKTRVICAELGVDLAELELEDNVAEAVGECATGDKLGGWPGWIQRAERPSCPQCEAEMRLVIQIDSEDHIPYMFGDVGCGHVFQCPQHADVLAFGWACS